MTGGPAIGPRAPGALDSVANMTQASGRAPGALDSTVREATRTVAPPPAEKRRRGALWAWIVFILGIFYFFLPLIAAFEFSLGHPLGPVGAPPTLQYYENVLVDPDSPFFERLAYSFGVAVATIILSIAIIVPTAYWVRLKLPRLRPIVEFITLMPFVIPPVVLVFGLIRTFAGPPFQITDSELGSVSLLVAAYTILSFPYMYRAVDTGLRSIDIQSLTEAAQSLGAGWPRIIIGVIFPNIRVALLSGAFLTLAIVIGEYTIASFLLSNKTFAPYLSLLGQNRAFEPAGVSLISFGLTWIAMGAIALVGRGGQKVELGGAR